MYYVFTGATLECLIEKMVGAFERNINNSANGNGPPGVNDDIISDSCRQQVMRMAELVVRCSFSLCTRNAHIIRDDVQTDDFHLDRPLYFACREDRERVCKDVPSGNGKVFECLLHNKHDRQMAPKVSFSVFIFVLIVIMQDMLQCVSYLNVREQLLGRDAKMAHPLIDACEKDITKYQCGVQGQEPRADHYYLSFLILCLENGENAHGQQALEQECRHELQSYRQLLLTDFRINPDVVLHCATVSNIVRNY